MPTATKKITVLDLIQELQNFPYDAPVSLKDGEDLAYLVAGFQAGSDGVTIVIADDEGDEESDEESDDAE